MSVEWKTAVAFPDTIPLDLELWLLGIWLISGLRHGIPRCRGKQFFGEKNGNPDELHGQSCEEDAKQHRFARGGHHH